MPLGPFDIDADRIAKIGPGFTEFVNRLLDLEVRAHGLENHLLAINYNENTPDGGVDAALRSALVTDWLPAGDSAWQFKRSGLGPTGCANELETAGWAHEFIREGGSYILVLGVALPDNLIETRRRKVVQKAIDIGLIDAKTQGQFRVYDANRLSRWASRYPALAVSRLTGGPGSVAVDYETWASGRTHDKSWVADAERESAIQTIREQVWSPGIVEVRVQGQSGIGKTRLVLEALNDESVRRLVVYVSDERAVGGELLAHLIEGDRIAILVVDECPAERHIKLVEKLPADPAIKLVTIGDSGAAATRSPIVAVSAMPPPEVEEFLTVNYPPLRAEARRFVTDHCRGNMRWTIVLADRVSGMAEAQAADLIARDDIERFVASILPEGEDFFCSTVLALLERVGWDRDLRFQLEALAGFAGVSMERMDSVGMKLKQRGLLATQGRYRAVGPHPLAVYLAAEAWRSHGDRILSELLPELNDEMAVALFQRVADLGQFAPAKSVLPELLSETSPFASLEQVEAQGLGKLLTQLAIVLPDEVMLHLGELIEAASLDQLRTQTGSRRDLVWTLEKLAWHKRTFAKAANSLLRLALAENENFANNATGTWLDLFGTFLPATAATPEQRLEYLSAVARDARDEVRQLAIKGAAKGLVHRETVTVSGELQGGALVEPRGTPGTYAEAGEYRRSVISLLASLLEDDDASVARSAENALFESLHALIDDPYAGKHLADVLVGLQGSLVQRVRTEVEQLLSLYRKTKHQDHRVPERLQELLERLPSPSKLEELQMLVHLRRWNFEEGELESRIDRTLSAMSVTERQSVLEMITEQDLPAAWEVGRSFGLLADESDSALDRFIGGFEINPSALVGYLAGLVQTGRSDAFDDFFESKWAQRLSLKDRLAITVRGPVTTRARERLQEGLPRLPVADGANVLFGWQRNLSDREVEALLVNWLERISSQTDYEAVIDWFNLWLHGHDDRVNRLADRALRLIMLRRQFPKLTHREWDWARIAGLLISDHGIELAQLVLDLIDSDSLMIHEGAYEGELLIQSARLHSETIWNDLAERLSQQSWRIEMSVRGWLLDAFPPEIIEAWVGDDVARARVVASIAPVGDAEPTAAARMLLGKFGEDQQISSNLASEFVSGFWTGAESDRIARQIEQLNSWRRNSTEPLGVRSWARQMIRDLEVSRRAALEREAERGY